MRRVVPSLLARGCRAVPDLSARSDLLTTLAVILAAAICVPVAYYAMFTNFPIYDDEGALLIALRQYSSGGILYDELYSRYGPAYFQLLDAVFRLLHLPYTHSNGRSVTIVAWLTSSALCSLATYRLSRNLPVALCAQLLVFANLAGLCAEPLHPGGLLCLSLGALVLVGSFLGRGRSRVAAALMGVLLAGATLMKINIGLFALASTVFALLTAARLGGGGAVLKLACAAGMVAAAPLLMLSRLAEPSVGVYAAIVSLSMLAVSLTCLLTPLNMPRAIGDLWILSAAFGATLLSSCVAMVARGTTLAGLADGLLLDPIRSPSLFSIPLLLPQHAVAYALLSVVVCAGFAIARHRLDHQRVAVALGLAQIVAGILVALVALRALPLSPFAISLQLLWLSAASVDGDEPDPERLGKRFLVAVAGLQVLHAYPVAGSQRDWATFLLIPAAAIAAADGWRVVIAALRGLTPVYMPRARLVGTVAGLLLTAMVAKAVAYDGGRNSRAVYHAFVPLGLPGTEQIRVSRRLAVTLRGISIYLSRKCGAFLTMPGLYSFYFFTGTAPPNMQNATAWMALLTAAEQAAIRDRFALQPRPHCVVRSLELAAESTMRMAARDLPKGPLVRYIEDQFVTARNWRGYEVMVERAAKLE